MPKARKNYTPQEKVALLLRHLIDRVAVSDLCDEYQLQPTLFNAWQKQFFENGAAALFWKRRFILLMPASRTARLTEGEKRCQEPFLDNDRVTR